ncbi:UDP-N-acetylmuramoyl-L-alanyl-D-glutamate--2,6-diaminopimelate ligase [Achromobacter insolitus]|uniref:bifunctional UDP-N-acetylmuramoyl-L-alanyl-D-glutamate--2, 6-diaminopimelate ligase MurE/UDP-N-acetylmuramoyl-tripeptide--D-alanyl-D-alanine ligase MurF n=1 Tax=Achromobacter insolitus TaxID=217204 RepID=UPI0009728CDE|nr:bifunctional UDP-N-acetylmuramoyl-L-alanyl-D-glutamate--2,6-diaminopimelate ligase MurE/UDP-N-acetylmuramoyl-tripeptide--D-alanyl-D-alanine ligase MurF [Achromobacter insolitus]APX77194.1 UDP-N-acetylmuramoyl-tripeptide--D-alanyl-D-alanine ligase [Achromobacter insolitus]OWT65364.1 UDP-N-acetylmuramoyl-L-alanyl-D-glutamate--2,6-diaminopimelate ligase [Achromobacter insolitus]CAB3727778.1 UDP-N-acetylmuramoyl-L-alanyl-D-glutamate--2, 6-diaminopimelate ligase [Achromobacter insolitus]VEG72120.
MSAKGFLSNPVATVAETVAWLHSRVSLTAHLKLDSRDIEPGDVFVACPGLSSDGRLYIEKALALGASAVLFEAPASEAVQAVADHAPMLPVTGLRSLLGELADTWYGRPSAALAVVAVTGTNGKTSSVQWIAHALSRNDKPCGTIGTLGAVLPDGRTLGGDLTTPDVLTVHRTLAAMRDAGAKAVAMEASSIGIEQGRMDGVRVALAAFTNLTRDHLDYHGTMERYEAAKARLFRWPGLTAAVINADDEAGRRLIADLPAGMAMGYSLSEDPEIPAGMRARELQATAQGQIFTLVSPHGEAQIVTRLLGAHNVSNLLLVAGVLYQLGLPFAQIARELAATDPVDGRLQTVEPVAQSTQADAGRGPLVVVDYAHTPDALSRALSALRAVATARAGRLVCLFGCGGERDPGKRPVMGRIAADLADHVVVSSDNPRTESPEAIVEQILTGIPETVRPNVQVDRARAIMQTIWAAAPDDVVLLAGKGHETYQDIGGEKLPFDDREWARLALLLPQVKGVSTDTRRIGEGELFVALVGENFDAHNYLDQAEARGACAAVVAHAMPEARLPQLVLGDTRIALMRIGAAWRARFALPVVAVTGSNGKTTTKEMISAMLAEWQGEGNRLATAGNLNNDIGVPLTLLRLRPEHRAAVFELGMNHPGEIAQLAAIAAPTVTLVTNAQREHQEFMHSVEAVARENGAAISALPEDGVAVYPGDEPYSSIWDALAEPRRVLRFGLQPGLDVYAEQIIADVNATRCRVVTPVGVADLALPVPGLHNLRNALAAIASAIAAGAPLEGAVRALARFSPVAGRMQHKSMSDGTLLIDDTYNANPDSVRVAVDVLARMAGMRILVLGDMGEVGDNGPAMHVEVGNYAREQGLDALITLGEASRAAAAAFGVGAHACASVDEVVAALRGLRPSCVLVKGSRFMRMERVVTAFSLNDGTAAKGQGEQNAA